MKHKLEKKNLMKAMGKFEKSKIKTHNCMYFILFLFVAYDKLKDKILSIKIHP